MPGSPHGNKYHGEQGADQQLADADAGGFMAYRRSERPPQAFQPLYGICQPDHRRDERQGAAGRRAGQIKGRIGQRPARHFEAGSGRGDILEDALLQAQESINDGGR